MKKNRLFPLMFISMSLMFAGCAGLLRDEGAFHEPQAYEGSTGGVWPERGILEGDDPAYSSYQMEWDERRAPAAQNYGNSANSDSWISEDRQAQGKRDTARDAYARAGIKDEFISKQNYKNGVRATRLDFQDNESDGSLWADGGQTNYYFTKNKVRSIGDILTLKVEDEMVQTVAAELKSRLTENEFDYEIAELEKIRKQKKDDITTTASAPKPQEPLGGSDSKAESERSPASAMKDPLVGLGPDEPITPMMVNLSPNISLKPNDTMMAEILERYPNGNYKVRGSKMIQYRNSKRIVRVLGIVKPSDIGEDDVVSSGKLYEYRAQVYR